MTQSYVGRGRGPATRSGHISENRDLFDVAAFETAAAGLLGAEVERLADIDDEFVRRTSRLRLGRSAASSMTSWMGHEAHRAAVRHYPHRWRHSVATELSAVVGAVS